MIQMISNGEQLNDKLNRTDGKLIILVFYAIWCAPCIRTMPIIECLSEKYRNIIFLKSDVDINIESSMKYEITNLPSFMLFKNREIVKRFSGATKEELMLIISKFIK